MRTTVLATVLVFILLLGGLTVYVIVNDGMTILTVLSLGILALFGFGIVGALREPDDD